MEQYERLELHAKNIKIRKMEMPEGLDGLYYDGNIVLDKSLSYKQRVEILAEELGHHYTSAGDIQDYNDIKNIKQEVKARRFGYELIVTLDGIIDAFKQHIRNVYELADYFEVTTDYIYKAIDHYKQKYGLSTIHGDYLIRFEPLNVYKYIKF